MLSTSLADTASIARQFAERLEPAEKGATIIALSGDLGSGKTTFVKSFAESFGILPDQVTSPTFIIEKRFPIQGHAYWKTLIHIDAYRLEEARDIERIRWSETIQDPHNLILVEWPEKLGSAMPAENHSISFMFKDENTREIVFN